MLIERRAGSLRSGVERLLKQLSNLNFHILGRLTGPLGNDLHLHIVWIGEGFDRQFAERL